MNRYNPFNRWLTVQMLAAFVSASTVLASTLPLPPARTTESITATELKMHLGFLASDELGGRYTFSPSLKLAARYLASRLESYGYRGAARDGSFFQVVPLGYRNVNRSLSEVVINAAGTSKTFKYGEGFLSMSPADLNIEGELVFAGHGVSSPGNNHDDYAGLDVKGKIVVLKEGLPPSLNAAALLENERGEEAALTRGAVGVIRVAPPHYLSSWEDVTGWIMREQLGLVPRPAVGKSIPTIIAGPPLVEALAGLMKIDRSHLTTESEQAPKPARIQGSARIKMAGSVKLAPPTQNVVAVLEGSDPVLKNEYLVISAHYDHLETRSNGEVYNGADDDGSGTSAVLEIAQAFSIEPRSKRSILVVFHTAEELGLFGSEFNTDHEPVVPLRQLVANLNIDMIGRSREPGNNDSRDRALSDKDSVYIIGADKLSAELHRLSEQTNADLTRLKFDYTYNDESNPERFYYRSDHYNYAKHGIPVIFYFTGVHRDYHRVSDDIEKIDFQKMERISRLIFATGWRIANQGTRLVVDKK